MNPAPGKCWRELYANSVPAPVHSAGRQSSAVGCLWVRLFTTHPRHSSHAIARVEADDRPTLVASGHASGASTPRSRIGRRSRHERCHALYEFQRPHHDVGGAVAPGTRPRHLQRSRAGDGRADVPGPLRQRCAGSRDLFSGASHSVITAAFSSSLYRRRPATLSLAIVST